jgi:hypothetical protein
MEMPLAQKDPVIAYLITLVASGGTYEFLARCLSFLVNDIRWIKKRIFGSSFIEGTWAGYYIGLDNVVYYVVETVQQTLTTMSLWGTGFTESGEIRSTWNSQAMDVNPKSRTMVQAYDCTYAKTGQSVDGIGRFTLLHKGGKPPHRKEGFIADVTDAKRQRVAEEKFSDQILDHTEALPFARERWQQSKKPPNSPH